jgi:hypothetical protein
VIWQLGEDTRLIGTRRDLHCSDPLETTGSQEGHMWGRLVMLLRAGEMLCIELTRPTDEWGGFLEGDRCIPEICQVWQSLPTTADSCLNKWCCWEETQIPL